MVHMRGTEHRTLCGLDQVDVADRVTVRRQNCTCSACQTALIDLAAAPFGRALRRARKGADLTQREVGELVGRDKNTIARWERGERLPEPLVQDAVLARLRLAEKPAE